MKVNPFYPPTNQRRYPNARYASDDIVVPGYSPKSGDPLPAETPAAAQPVLPAFPQPAEVAAAAEQTFTREQLEAAGFDLDEPGAQEFLAERGVRVLEEQQRTSEIGQIVGAVLREVLSEMRTPAPKPAAPPDHTAEYQQLLARMVELSSKLAAGRMKVTERKALQSEIQTIKHQLQALNSQIKAKE